MAEGIIYYDEEKMKKSKKPMIFSVTPNLRRKRFMKAEDGGGNENLEEQGCYPDCSPCNPCSPCSPSEWSRDECYPDCNPCSPCSPCKPGEWDVYNECYPNCNPCSPCYPCKPDERGR